MENIIGKHTIIFRISELCHIINSCRTTGGNPNQYYDELETLLERYQQSKNKQADAADTEASYLLASLR